jgi:hypothetical protein
MYIPTLQRNLPPPPSTSTKDFLAPPWSLSSLKYEARGFSGMSVPNYKVPIVTSDSTFNVTDNDISTAMSLIIYDFPAREY